MIIRVKDERSSDICKAIEELAEEKGGLEFPFSIGKYHYDEKTLEKAMLQSNDYYTHIFHENCRSTLVPVSSNSNIMYPGKELDDTDRLMLTSGATSEVATAEMVASGEVSDEGIWSFVKNKFNTKKKQVLSWISRMVGR